MKTLMSQFLALSLFLTSCASHHSGALAEAGSSDSDDARMIVSAERIWSMSDATHSMIVFTFQNNRRDWARIKGARFSCGEVCDAQTNIILGQDLQAWSRSEQIKKSVSQHNDGLLYAGALILGTAIAFAGAGKGSEGTMNTGLAIMGAGTAASVYSDVKNSQLETKLGKIEVNSDHVYAPFSVPASGFAKKWILVNTPRNDQLSTVFLTLESVDGKEEKYAVRL